jgi:hypothetical protein
MAEQSAKAGHPDWTGPEQAFAERALEPAAPLRVAPDWIAAKPVSAPARF